MSKAIMVALALAAVGTAAAAVDFESIHFSAIGGRGPLAWNSGCRAPLWGSFRHGDPQARATVAAEYTIFYACLRKTSAEDEKFAIDAVDSAAKEELQDATDAGRAAGWLR